MVEPSHAQHILRFGQFEFDLQTGELRRRGLEVKIAGQPLQILAILLEHPSQVITREQIQRKLWPADTFVEFEQSLNAAVRRLREALGESADNPRFLETVPHRGYRFIAPVDKQSQVPTLHRLGIAVPEPTRARRPYAVLLSVGSILGILAVLLLALNVNQWREWLRGETAPPRIDSLAVLPLENLSHDLEEGYFADGMTDELITDLGKLGVSRVISRTSVMHYKGTRKPLAEIVRELNVDAIIEGTVLRSGGRVRITARLVARHPERQLWAEIYDRDLRDILALQSELARDVAEQVSVKLESQIHLARTRQVNPEAYEAYLKGRYYWNKFTEAGLWRAIEYFEQAIDKQPDFARAYSGIADSYYRLVYTVGPLAPAEGFPKAKAAAEQALQIDNAIAEAHSSLANIRLYYIWDLPSADREARRATELDSNYAEGHHTYSHCLVAEGRIQEAFVETRRALAIDPVDLAINNHLAWNYLFARQYAKSAETSRKTLEMEPNFAVGHWYLGLAYELEGASSAARAEYQKAASLSKRRPTHLAGLARALALEGKRGEALKILSELKSESTRRYVPAYDIAHVYAALGDKDECLHWLEKGFNERASNMIYLRLDRRFDALHADQRFQRLIQRMGLPPLRP
jgi:TolB-like protein/DNA-binding winged helix-turn-helix (wHTH) protein/Flp pilus assembly protein TadD